jgi:hypothetical protein
MARELQRIVIPALFAHFSSPPLRDRLRTIYAWGHSFEQWFKWEAVAALEPIVCPMKGDPWDPNQWHLEYRKHQRKLGVLDMALLGTRPLFLHFKVFVPWAFNWGWIVGRENCLLNDITKAREFRDAAAATLLLFMAHPGKEIDLRQEGVPPPDNPRAPKISLGTVAYYPDLRPIAARGVYAQLLCWTNSR